GGEYVEVLAHHARRGEVWAKAVAYLRQAGAKAAARSAFHEAAPYYGQALEALGHLPGSRDTREQAIDLLLDLSGALWTLGEVAQHGARLREAEALAERLEGPRRPGRGSAHLTSPCRWRGAAHVRR